MSYNMNLPRSSHYTATKHSKTKSQVETATSSSDYSTCSDNPQMNMYWNKQKPQASRESDILAGHIALNQTTSTTVLEDTNFSISPLDLNVDESDDVFDDCRDYSYSSSDSTMYMPLEQIFDSKENQLDLSNNNPSSSQAQYREMTATGSEDCPSMIGTLHERLITIIEETEFTNATDHFVEDLSPKNPNQNIGQFSSKIIDEIKTHEEQNNNYTRKVLFVNLDNVVDNHSNAMEPKKTPTSRPEGSMSRKAICNHNTTESFVLWEKFCEASEKHIPRRSFSFTQLNTVTESCSGDDEYSTSCRTLDDMHISGSSLETENYREPFHRRNTMYRSKSCESILREVKHLPHIMYDKFLKCLSEEIDRIRKKKVVCTCQKSDKKNSNKENERRRKSPKKSVLKLTNKITNVTNSEKASRLPLRVGNYTGTANTTRLLPKTTYNACLSPTTTNSTRLSPTATNNMRLSPKAATLTRLSPGAANRTRLSPECTYGSRLSPEAANRMILSPGGTSNNLSQFQTSPKSPMRTPTTPSKNRYFWNKQIVSPVGEYIRGKRQSPFQSSPTKKK